MIPDLETLFTDQRYWGVDTAAPVQRAACRIVEGRPLGSLVDDPDVRWAVGGDAAAELLAPGGPPPKQVSIYGAVRIGKSDLAACVAFRASQVIDLNLVRAHEVPRIPIVSLTKDLADVTFGHLVGRLHNPALRPLLVDEGADFVTVRHPSGSVVEIVVAAGARAGGSLISRWIGGVVFDEKPRMLSEQEAVINYPDALHAVEGRLLPGAQVIDLGSPWAPWGPAWDDVQERWGKPTRHHVVLRATGPMANPRWWTPTRCADLRDSKPRVYQTECLGNFADAQSSALESEWVDRAFRQPPPGFIDLTDPIGVIDSSAGGGDAFVWCVAAWCIARQDVEYEMYIAEDGAECFCLGPGGQHVRKPMQSPPAPFMRMWAWDGLGGQFRNAHVWDELLDKMASTFLAHGASRAVGDRYQELPMMSGMRRRGIHFEAQNWSTETKSQALGRVKTWFRDGAIVIDGGLENAIIRRELVQLQVKPKSDGGETIGARRKGHDDRAALVLNVGMLDVLGEFRGSPVAIPRGLIVDAPGQLTRYFGT